METAARTAALAALPAAQPTTTSQQRERLTFPASSFVGPRISKIVSLRPLLQGHHGSQTALWSSPVNEVVLDASTNAAALNSSTLEAKEKDEVFEDVPEQAKEASIAAVMIDVANLVKLVDSRDIVELELKHFDYELVIRKKEALPPPPVAGPSSVGGQFPYYAYAPPAPPPAAPAPAPASASAPPTPMPPTAPAAPPASNLPCILSPMAGTFYKCPAPGEPPFVKIGDKVQKGQVICIVEAMKLMNEIEADQSGTIVEFIAEDGKPVAVDTPLFAINA